jgi:hypothetical protein
VRFEERWPPSTGSGDPHRFEYRKKLPIFSRVNAAFKKVEAEIQEDRKLPAWYDIHCNSMMIERSAKHPERPASRVGISHIPNDV